MSDAFEGGQAAGDRLRKVDDYIDGLTARFSPMTRRQLWNDISRELPHLAGNDMFSLSPETRDRVNALAESVAGELRMSDLARLHPDLGGRIPDAYWELLSSRGRQLVADAGSVPALYSLDQLASAAEKKKKLRPRPTRTAEEFFNTHIIEIDSVESMLKAIYRLQSKRHEHQLVWRGQQVASWAVHSSLYRHLENTGVVEEDRLVETELIELGQAMAWGVNTQRPLDYFAQLQHQGAPTRLIDVSLDPEMAVWFAVEEHSDHDAADGLVLAWGRAPRVGKTIRVLEEVTARYEDTPFWHLFVGDEIRAANGWGTGTRTWPWFPPALSDRMRAQRAGFLLEAGPIITDNVVDVFNDVLAHAWTAEEIANATSIVGLPSRHDVLTKQNGAHLVPMFTFRISADAKPEIRRYLVGKGLHTATVYPDLGGLVKHLRRRSGNS